MYTVSPYDRHFFRHVDEGIHDVVQAFLDKGYLPYSSCEGHNGSRKFIAIALHPDLGTTFQALSRKGLVLKKLNHNATIEFIRKNGKLIGLDEPYLDIDNHIQELNTLYRRNYLDYVIADITFTSNEKLLRFIKGLPHYAM